MDYIGNVRVNKQLVRIQIGATHTGMAGIKKPIKTITLVDTDVIEIHEIILDAIDKARKRK